jgi:3-methyladenine DNA glycosylase AlkD
MNYLYQLAQAFEQSADPEVAQGQKAYLKNQFEFFGLKSQQRRDVQKAFVKEHGWPSLEAMPDMARAAYEWPQREMHYFGMELVGKYKEKLNPTHFPLIRHLILTHSWWDTVDYIASSLVGAIVKRFPEQKLLMDDWSQSEELWLQRSAILHQLKYKQETDVKRLFRYCEAGLSHQDFFIRKAIGWALREYSKVDARAVQIFVENHPKLSGLSRREALKWLERQKKKKS